MSLIRTIRIRLLAFQVHVAVHSISFLCWLIAHFRFDQSGRYRDLLGPMSAQRSLPNAYDQ
jgi:hypothetical protein